jgi:hypothetical protein
MENQSSLAASAPVQVILAVQASEQPPAWAVVDNKYRNVGKCYHLNGVFIHRHLEVSKLPSMVISFS